MPQVHDTRWQRQDLELVPYGEALDLQYRLADKVRSGKRAGTVLFLEHAPVFTLGKRGGRENLTVSDDFLAARDVAVFETERGGNITYHGPGQLVVYPIINLKATGLGVADYVERLEEVMLRTALDWGVRAERNAKNRGIWIENNKLGSIGIAVKRGIALHGLALNVTTDLAPFGWINPCGLTDIGIISLAMAGAVDITIEKVRDVLAAHMAAVFNIQWKGSI
ncbi:MAG: lipoyl(octanoyl) transferase LipB [Desulfobacterales bacterium]|nr:lipoyl(octanoyl) transferase LipB [Desulfobacterales bacterium]